jgi:hypothetical protein
LGADDQDGMDVMWFAGTGTSKDQVNFTWHADAHLSAIWPITVTAFGIIEDTPTAAMDKCFFELYWSGACLDGSAVPPSSESKLTSLYAGSAVVWTPYSSGSPFSSAEQMEFVIDAATITASDKVVFALNRNPVNANDDFEFPVGIYHLTISYRRTDE